MIDMIIKLEEKIECALICKAIQKLINSTLRDNDFKNKAISIKIVDVLDGGDYHIPKIEYKPD